MNHKKYSFFVLQQAIRNFFKKEDFIDIVIPPAVSNPGMEAHIHPFQLFSVHQNSKVPLYLQTSPEFALKELLSEGFEKVFSLTYSFRDEIKSSTHRPQFLMLEWYRTASYYEKIQQDSIELIQYCQNFLIQKNIIGQEKKLIPVIMTVEESFQKFANFSILDHPDSDSLAKVIRNNFPNIFPQEKLEWEDYFHLIFLNIIEPQFKKINFLILKEYPAEFAALSTLKASDPRVCERFEIYLKGIEIANCFNELTDINEQRKRFDYEAKKKKRLYQYELPIPEVLYKSLERGIPKSAGIALGVERLLMALTDSDDIHFMASSD